MQAAGTATTTHCIDRVRKPFRPDTGEFQNSAVINTRQYEIATIAQKTGNDIFRDFLGSLIILADLKIY